MNVLMVLLVIYLVLGFAAWTIVNNSAKEWFHLKRHIKSQQPLVVKISHYIFGYAFWPPITFILYFVLLFAASNAEVRYEMRKKIAKKYGKDCLDKDEEADTYGDYES